MDKRTKKAIKNVLIESVLIMDQPYIMRYNMKNLWYSEITEDVLKNLKEKYLNLLANYPADSRVKRFYDEFTNSFVYNSNAIEGNPITENDTYIILSSNSFLENYTQKANEEVLSLFKGHKFIFTKPALNIETLLQTHKYVLYFDPDNAGVFRNIPVRIGDKNLLPFEDIPASIERLFSGIVLTNDNIFEVISEFHLRFENIHPFVDGNGRTGRLLINLMLIQKNYLPINLKFTDRSKYYRAFRQYDINTQKGVNELYSLITKCQYDELTAFINLFNI